MLMSRALSQSSSISSNASANRRTLVWRNLPVIALMAWGVLWSAALLVPGDVLVQWGWTLNAHGHTHLYAHGHPFADARSWWGIPNTMDVLSNLPLLILGAWGLWCWPKSLRPLMGDEGGRRAAAQVQLLLPAFFGGLVLTGIGSSVYHAWPSAMTLVADRLGMAIAFAAAIGMAFSDRAGERLGIMAWTLALPMAVLGAFLPWAQQLVLPWVVVQFGGVVLLMLCLMRPSQQAFGGCTFPLVALLFWYALAKVLESGDAWVWHASGEWVAGHSLKHLAAAMAAWPVLQMMSRGGRACGTMRDQQKRATQCQAQGMAGRIG